MNEARSRSDFEYRAAIFGYKRLMAWRKWFRKRQEAREKPSKNKEFGLRDWILRLTIEKRWFAKLPQRPEINLVLCGNGRRYIIECYPGKSKAIDEAKVRDLELAWRDYKSRPTAQRQLVLDFIVAVIMDAADAGHIHDLSDTANPVVSGIFRAYKITCASKGDVPLADIDLSDFIKGEWIYRVPGATLAQAKKIWELNHSYNETSLGSELALDHPEISPDAIRIRPKKHTPARSLPKTGGTHATEFAFGIEAETRKKIAVPIAEMRHTFGIGTTGAGKTTLLEGLMLTALGARELVEAVYCIDIGKEGEELEHVKAAGAIFGADFDAATDIVNTIWDIRNSRVGKKDKGRFVFLFVDEAAQIFDPDEEERARVIQLRKRLIRIAQLGRSAKIRLITFTQKPTIEFVPSSYLDLHDGRICLRVQRERTATDFMGVDFEWSPRDFADGEFAMRWPGWRRERYGRGFISDKMR